MKKKYIIELLLLAVFILAIIALIICVNVNVSKLNIDADLFCALNVIAIINVFGYYFAIVQLINGFNKDKRLNCIIKIIILICVAVAEAIILIFGAVNKSWQDNYIYWMYGASALFAFILVVYSAVLTIINQAEKDK